MLPVLIFDTEPATRSEVIVFLNEFARESGERFSIVGNADSVEDAAFCIRSEEGVFLAILGVGEDSSVLRETVTLERDIVAKNRDSYTLYWLRDLKQLPALASACLHPVGFILPPPDQSHFNGILKRVTEDYASFSTASAEDFLSLQSGGSMYRLNVGEIDYMEALDKKLNIWTKRQCVTVYEKLANMEETLGERFFRCHRSYLVNYSHIERVDYAAMEVQLKNGTVLPLSRSSKDRLKERTAREGSKNAG